jgi:DNA polymerase-3 subunit epsilon
MILFFDTETTGLADFNARARDPKQPHIVQLAAILTDDEGRAREEHNIIVKPDGWEIPKEASDYHGITQDIALQFGLLEKQVAEIFLAMLKRAGLLVAHNLMFDKFIARIAMRRYELIADADDQWWKTFPIFCTMKAMTNVCKIPPTEAMRATGRNGFKNPKLQEAYQTAFGKPFEGAHDAMADIRACKELYFWLKKPADKKV